MPKTLSDLKINDKIHFLNYEPKPYILKAKGGKFLIATVEDGNYKRYTIIDTEEGFCGPNDRTFNPYDYTKQEAIDECLSDFLEGKYGIGISRRYGAKVEEVLDLQRTLGGE